MEANQPAIICSMPVPSPRRVAFSVAVIIVGLIRLITFLTRFHFLSSAPSLPFSVPSLHLARTNPIYVLILFVLLSGNIEKQPPFWFDLLWLAQIAFAYKWQMQSLFVPWPINDYRRKPSKQKKFCQTGSLARSIAIIAKLTNTQLAFEVCPRKSVLL